MSENTTGAGGDGSMKDCVIAGMALVPSAASIIGAVYLISIGVETGWGWLIFAAVVTYPRIKTGSFTSND